jgi:hypothetical protein
MPPHGRAGRFAKKSTTKNQAPGGQRGGTGARGTKGRARGAANRGARRPTTGGEPTTGQDPIENFNNDQRAQEAEPTTTTPTHEISVTRNTTVVRSILRDLSPAGKGLSLHGSLKCKVNHLRGTWRRLSLPTALDCKLCFLFLIAFTVFHCFQRDRNTLFTRPPRGLRPIF